MYNYIKMEIALDILARNIAEINIELRNGENEELKKELERLISYREKIYAGDKECIDEIIKLYGRNENE